MRSSRSDAPALALAALLACGAAQAGGDARRGSDVFAAECAECHSPRPGKHKKGPSLHGVLGRPAAQAADFKFSDALRASGWTWDEPTLARYLANPARALPGGKMKYDGLADAAALQDLQAYLATLR